MSALCLSIGKKKIVCVCVQLITKNLSSLLNDDKKYAHKEQ